jgi:hypothetical protein
MLESAVVPPAEGRGQGFVSENRVMRKILGVARGWGKLHNEDLHDLYPWKNVIKMVKTRENEMGVAYSTYEIMGNFLLVGTTVGF